MCSTLQLIVLHALALIILINDFVIHTHFFYGKNSEPENLSNLH